MATKENNEPYSDAERRKSFPVPLELSRQSGRLKLAHEELAVQILDESADGLGVLVPFVMTYAGRPRRLRLRYQPPPDISDLPTLA